MSRVAHVIDVDSPRFDREVVERSHQVPVVVDFWAPWCGPCRTLGPTLEALAEAGEGAWVLAKVNVDQNQALAQEYRVQGIPAVKAIVNGRVVDEFTGAQPRAVIEAWLERLMPSRADEAIELGERAEQAGELDKAEQVYRSAVEEQPHHAAGLLGLARIALARDDVELASRWLEAVLPGAEGEDTAEYQRIWFTLEAADLPRVDELRSRVEADPSDLEARWELGVALAAAGHYEAALSELLQIVMRDRDFGDDLGRETMVRIFHILGQGSDETREWQKRLGRAMY